MLLFFIAFSACIESKNEDLEIPQISHADTINVQTSHESIDLSDSTVNLYFQEIYKQQSLTWSEEELMLTIVDSLNSKDAIRQCYYFEVFTFSMNGADGFFAESIGYSALEFVNLNTEQFASCFLESSLLTDNDLINWSKFVYSEIQISNENEEDKALSDLIDHIDEKSKSVDLDLKEVLLEFSQHLRSHLSN